MRSFVVASIFLFLLGMLLWQAPGTEAFAPSSSFKRRRAATFNRNSVDKMRRSHGDAGPTTTTVALEAYKKKEPVETPKEDKEETPPLTMFLAYMTPWRNPNSIFVYLFLMIYILGSYSEAKSAAGM